MNEMVKESTAEEKELTKDLALPSPAGDASSAVVYTDEAWATAEQAHHMSEEAKFWQKVEDSLQQLPPKKLPKKQRRKQWA